MKKKKLLLLGDYIDGSGSEIFARKLVSEFKSNGWNVRCVYEFGTPLNEDQTILKMSSIEKHLSRFFSLRGVRKQICDILNVYSPDLVIVNNVYGYILSALKELKDYKVVRIIHDCRCICHACQCINEKQNICQGYMYGNCYNCGKEEFSTAHIFIKLYLQKKLNRSYKLIKAVNIFPSDWLKSFCELYEIQGTTINNFVDKTTITQSHCLERKKYSYLGTLSKPKGAELLLEQFYKFSINKDVILEIAGPVDSSLLELLNFYCKKSSKINYIGKINNNNVPTFLKDTYCLIVPSLIMDNYPTSILDGISAGKLIIGSNLGGIPEMIKNEKLIFDPKIEDDLERVLNYTFYISNDLVTEFTLFESNFIKEHSIFNYYTKLLLAAGMGDFV